MKLPNYLLTEADYSQGEWVIVAYMSQDKNMLRVVTQHFDAHATTAELMLNFPYEWAKKEDKFIDKVTDAADLRDKRAEFIATYPEVALLYNKATVVPPTMTFRQSGKKDNHSLNYDIGAFEYAKKNRVDVATAKLHRNLYYTVAYPGLPQWHQEMQELVRATKSYTNPFGRKRVFLRSLGDKLYKEFYANAPQSTLVDCTNQALYQLYHSDDEDLIDCIYSLHGHDSLTIQFPLAKGKASFLRFLEKLTNTMRIPITIKNQTFKLDIDIKAGFGGGQALKGITIEKVEATPWEQFLEELMTTRTELKAKSNLEAESLTAE